MKHNAAAESSTGLPRRLALFVLMATAATALSLHVVSLPQRDNLQRIRSTGVLRVSALQGKPYCFRDEDGHILGLECELVEGFAKRLGVRARFHFAGSVAEVLDDVREARADLGTGGIDRDPAYRRFVLLGPTVRQVTEQLIYNRDASIPKGLDRLGGDLLVVADSPASAVLEALQDRIPALEWEETREDDSAALLEQVADGDLDYTIADSDLALIMRQRYPQLRVAFDLGEPRERVWALPQQGSATLTAAIRDYLRQTGPLEMRRLEDAYLGRTIHMLSYRDAAHFADDIAARLPPLRRTFEAAAARYGLDWRLLAAIGYQESHWNRDAVSKTGVRGIMMLTNDTAAQLGITDRADVEQSILGAARYLASLRDLLPTSVTEPDRSWMALAAYNIGIGHLLDARELTRLRGGNPDLWRDVRKSLPLLARSSWNSQTAHGYARGGETVIFVANVRAFYDILAWADSGAGSGDSASASPTGQAESASNARSA